jgi:hypothetical protein
MIKRPYPTGTRVQLTARFIAGQPDSEKTRLADRFGMISGYTDRSAGTSLPTVTYPRWGKLKQLQFNEVSLSDIELV